MDMVKNEHLSTSCRFSWGIRERSLFGAGGSNDCVERSIDVVQVWIVRCVFPTLHGSADLIFCSAPGRSPDEMAPMVTPTESGDFIDYENSEHGNILWWSEKAELRMMFCWSSPFCIPYFLYPIKTFVFVR